MSHTSSDDRVKRKRGEDGLSEGSDSQNDSCSRKRKKHKHDRSSVKKRHKKEKKKKSSSKDAKKDKKLHKRQKTSSKIPSDAEDVIGPTITVSASPEAVSQQPTTVQRSLGPMTKEQYEKKQSTIRRVFDEDTGRYRLIKGDGEIVEEIVSKERQQQINKIATAGDGMSFQSGLKQFYK